MAVDSKNVPERITESSGLRRVVEDDCHRLAGCFNALDVAWRHVEDVDDICKLVGAQTKLLQSRRELLGLPYGAPAASGGKKRLYGAYDDEEDGVITG